jgi:hypothetical protein
MCPKRAKVGSNRQDRPIVSGRAGEEIRGNKRVCGSTSPVNSEGDDGPPKQREGPPSFKYDHKQHARERCRDQVGVGLKRRYTRNTILAGSRRVELQHPRSGYLNDPKSGTHSEASTAFAGGFCRGVCTPGVWETGCVLHCARMLIMVHEIGAGN